MRERDIERYLVERVTAIGGIVRKVRWIGRRGAPDRLVLLPPIIESLLDSTLVLNRPRDPIWVEIKAPGKKLQPHQEREIERLRLYGLRVEVVDSRERVDEVLTGEGHS
jgi:hypothetical protein